MPKEKSVNPAQAQRKAEKAKAVKKGKAENQARRNEKLARRNPERLQTQLDELKALESSGGKLTGHEKTLLEGLERDLKAVRKAREALGDKAPKFGSGAGERRGDSGRGGFGDRGGKGGRGGGVLGKRRRDDNESDESDVPEDVKSIPMPRDTPPPIPKEVLDKWYQARRERMGRERDSRGTNANNTPLGQGDRRARHLDGLPDKPVTAEPEFRKPILEAKTVYEAKPIVRDLRREAVAFVPAAVRVKLEKGKGVGGLVEPEEADRLEREGYMGVRRQTPEDGKQGMTHGSKGVMMEEVDDEDG